MKKLLPLFLLLFSFSFYAQNDTLSVVKHTDKDIIVNKESKVVYRGIVNTLSIEVPNCKSFTASANGLSMVSKNNYNLIPGAGTEVIITVDIVLNNNKKKTEKHVFSIKNIGSFVTSINEKKGIIRMQKKDLKDAIIKISFADKNLTFSNNVTQFSLKIPDMPSILVIGNKIDNDIYEKILKNVSKGDHIVISNIKTKVMQENMSGALICEINPIVIEIY